MPNDVPEPWALQARVVEITKKSRRNPPSVSILSNLEIASELDALKVIDLMERLAAKHHTRYDRPKLVESSLHKIDAIVDALERGIVTATTKERLQALEGAKAALQATVEVPLLPALHPNLAKRYSDAVARLEEELADRELAVQARSVLRSMIKTIMIYPGANRGEVQLELHGELAAILQFAQGAKSKAGGSGSRIQVPVVAGACFGRELKCKC